MQDTKFTRRSVLYVPEHFGVLHGATKMAEGLLRFRNEEVVAVISPTRHTTVQEALGWGGNIPIVDGIQEAMQYRPNTFVIAVGIAGGEFNYKWFDSTYRAAKLGLQIWNGTHTLLAKDHRFSQWEDNIWDLRWHPPSRMARGTWRTRKSKILLTVGTDSAVGKMTAGLILHKNLEAIGIKTAFISTGQVAMAITGNGVAIDAVPSDFVSGVVEQLIDDVDGIDLVIVEGQGALSNQQYSAVTLGLLHGTMPDYLLMVSPIADDHAIFNIKAELDLNLALMAPFKHTKLIGIGTNYLGLHDVTFPRYLKSSFDVDAEDFVHNNTSIIAKTVKELI